jgi:predicted transcriptional regulator
MHSSDNIHTALEKLAASDWDRSAASLRREKAQRKAEDPHKGKASIVGGLVGAGAGGGSVPALKSSVQRLQGLSPAKLPTAGKALAVLLAAGGAAAGAKGGQALSARANKKRVGKIDEEVDRRKAHWAPVIRRARKRMVERRAEVELRRRQAEFKKKNPGIPAPGSPEDIANPHASHPWHKKTASIYLSDDIHDALEKIAALSRYNAIMHAAGNRAATAAAPALYKPKR